MNIQFNFWNFPFLLQSTLPWQNAYSIHSSQVDQKFYLLSFFLVLLTESWLYLNKHELTPPRFSSTRHVQTTQTFHLSAQLSFLTLWKTSLRKTRPVTLKNLFQFCKLDKPTLNSQLNWQPTSALWQYFHWFSIVACLMNFQRASGKKLKFNNEWMGLRYGKQRFL